MSLQLRMSYNEKDDAAFAYESSVHSNNVLRRLSSQRDQGVLCDVTIVVEDQRFLAHRTVLAACSDFFLSRLVQPCDGDFIITLPEEVTVKGFVPLLQFAYTSKLLVNKDNLLEIQECAKILDVHDIEEACFEFLKLKYLDVKADLQECPRKKCCKSFCPKANAQHRPNSSADIKLNEVEELWRAVELPSKINCAAEIENISTVSESPKKPCETFCFDRQNDPDSSALCPKYRKFQKAFRSDRVRSISTCSSNQDAPSPLSIQSSDASENVILPRTQSQPLEMERNDVNPQDINVTYLNQPCEEKTNSKTGFLPCFPLGQQDLNSASFQCSYPPYGNLNYNEVHDPTIDVLPEKSSSEQHVSPRADLSNSKQGTGSDLCIPEERSNVEREVAEHLAKGFWSDIYNGEYQCQPEIEMVPNKESCEESSVEKRQECPWLNITISEGGERTFTTLNSVSCPFINTLSSEGCASNSQLMLEECVQEKPQDTCPYACSISLEGDSETDSEDDSGESCSAKELECEEKLPFKAQKIISLSRYDFQALVKRHSLTTEQLDCIHDIRRRSKNRVAAQRCRKRKLDCIQDLEFEIRKLQNEKVHLLKERDQILTNLGETKQNLTGLCQQVCGEAALSREQMQILSKYSSNECPLSFLIAEKDKLLLQCDSMLQACHEFAEGLPTMEAARQPDVCNGVLPVQTAATESIAPPSNNSQTGITDFCKQMTDKCTTDEQT